MSDVELTHRPTLGSIAPVLADRIRLLPLPEGTVLQVFGEGEHAPRLADAAARVGLSMRTNGPDRWYLVGDLPVSQAALSDLTDALPDAFSFVDQSHGLVRIAVEGDAVEDVLAKGTGVDLACFEVGQSTTTLFGHIAAHMTRTAMDRFELMPLRSFAESLWDDLRLMAAEYVEVPG